MRCSPSLDRIPSGRVLLLLRYYGALRLLLSRPTALRFLRLAVPSLVLAFRSYRSGERTMESLELLSRNPHRTLRMDVTVPPRFLGNLLRICPALRPRSDNGTRSVKCLCAAPVTWKTKAPTIYSFRGSITQLLHSLSTLHARNHFLPRKTRFRLLTRLYRAGLLPACKVPPEGFCLAASPFTRLILAQPSSNFERSCFEWSHQNS